jgi:hypothetical protein
LRRLWHRRDLIEPRREIDERANEERHRHWRTIDVHDFQKLFARRGLQCLETRKRCRSLLRRLRIQVMHHDHSAERDLLGKEAARAARGDVL